jgi:UPF0042 nucleotide-binding protein
VSRFLLVTGMAGAGRTTALKVLEDLGYEAVDNLPAALLGAMISTGDRFDRRVAVGIDCRSRAFDPVALTDLLDRREHDVDDLRLVFLDCESEVLRRRFTETRRRHPLASDRPIMDGIARERLLMEPLRGRASLVIDTSLLAPKDLRQVLIGHFGADQGTELVVSLISFGFRNGLPRESDFVFDVRFLRNPHYVEELRPLTGRDPPVRDYVQADAHFPFLLDQLTELMTTLLPSFMREGKTYLTIAFGCTGGRHRSVAVTEAFASTLRAAGWPALVQHRDTPEAHLRPVPGLRQREGAEP